MVYEALAQDIANRLYANNAEIDHELGLFVGRAISGAVDKVRGGPWFFGWFGPTALQDLEGSERVTGESTLLYSLAYEGKGFQKHDVHEILAPELIKQSNKLSSSPYEFRPDGLGERIFERMEVDRSRFHHLTDLGEIRLEELAEALATEEAIKKRPLAFWEHVYDILVGY